MSQIRQDIACTHVYPGDGYTWPYDGSSSGPQPPESGWFETNSGYMLGTDALSTPYIGPTYSGGYHLDRSYISVGADSDPTNYQPIAPGWWVDYKASAVHFPATELQQPANTIRSIQLVVHSDTAGYTPRWWVPYYSTDGAYQLAMAPCDHISDKFIERVGTFPPDFPIGNITNGWDTSLHYTITGGLYHAYASYLAIRINYTGGGPRRSGRHFVAARASSGGMNRGDTGGRGFM